MKPTTAPNILFVFADQMRGMDMGCAGNPEIRTPVMDRLASEGVLCERHYAVCPLCSPNRATMLTGTYPTTHRLMFNDTPMRFDLPSLGTLAKERGYRTGYIGKWHLEGGPRNAFIPPGPHRLGFDDFWAVRNCGHNYFATQYHGDTPEIIRQPGYEPEIQTQLAMDFMEQRATRGERFCLALSWGPPHPPYQEVPDAYRALYNENSLTMRPNCAPVPQEVLDPAWSQRPTTRDYYAQISSLDDMLGRLLAKLDELRIADETLVVFTSDHGEMLWSQGILYKSVPYEESIHVPLIIRCPGVTPSGTRCKNLISSADLLPTLAGLAGWQEVPTTEGLDLSDALRGRPDAPRQKALLLAHYSDYVFRPDRPVHEWRGLRTDTYTYAATSDRRPWLLFDNERDPYQMHNLAHDASARPVLDQLGGDLELFLQRTGDPFLPKREMARHFGIVRPHAPS
jgi:arylsulfatase A-like enzyme